MSEVVGALLAAASWLLVQPAPSVTCQSIGTVPQRTWRFDRAATRWRVTHWTGDDEARAAHVLLPPSTDVRLGAGGVHVKGRTSNGGIDVALSGPAADATLDIYISYELEVNVDASLTPAIDAIGTDGPIGVRCTQTPIG